MPRFFLLFVAVAVLPVTVRGCWLALTAEGPALWSFLDSWSSVLVPRHFLGFARSFMDGCLPGSTRNLYKHAWCWDAVFLVLIHTKWRMLQYCCIIMPCFIGRLIINCCSANQDEKDTTRQQKRKDEGKTQKKHVRWWCAQHRRRTNVWKPIRDTGTAIREFKKRHSGSIERVSEYRSIGYASIGYGYGWVSKVSVIHRCRHLSASLSISQYSRQPFVASVYYSEFSALNACSMFSEWNYGRSCADFPRLGYLLVQVAPGRYGAVIRRRWWASSLDVLRQWLWLMTEILMGGWVLAPEFVWRTWASGWTTELASVLRSLSI